MKKKHFPVVIGLLGGIVYLLLSLQIAYYSDGVMDEGSYLNKGYIYASGQSEPFEDYGPQTGKMPLSFLPYGYSQLIFGNGLKTGRFTAIFFGCLMLIPLWLTTKRLSNEWWATAAVWIIALNTTTLWNYSLAFSQPIVICLLAWSLYFVLGKTRTEHQVLIGVFLGSLLIFTRINVGVASVLLVVYVFWEHGKKVGIRSFVVWISVFLIGHMIYWPGILKIWAAWIPEQITPFLDNFRMSQEGVTGVYWNPTYSLSHRLESFFISIRSDFLVISTWLTSILLWPTRKRLKDSRNGKVIVFLFVTFSLLLLMHLWASLGLSYCSYCLENYLRFFDITAIMLFVAILPELNTQSSKLIQIIAIVIFIIALMGVSYTFYTDIGKFAYDFPAPRIKGGMIQLGGKSSVGLLLLNKYGMADLPIKQLASSILGLLLAILLLLFILSVYYIFKTMNKKFNYSFSYVLLLSFIFIGTPIFLILNSKPINREKNILKAHSLISNYLSENIISNSTVFWDGGYDRAPLLYISEPKLYFPQLNGRYTLFYGGDVDELNKFGYWNKEIAQHWKDEADYFIVSEINYIKWKDFFSPGKFHEFPPSPTSLTLDEGSTLLLFKRK